MNMLYATLVSAKQPPLEKRGSVVDAWHRHVSRIGAGTDHGDLMFVPGGRQPGIAAPAVGVDQSTRYRGGLNEGQKAGARDVLDATKTYPADALTVLFGGDRNYGLGFGIPAALAFFHTANIGLVHLYRSTERVPSRADHCPAQLVQPGPRRLVTSEAKNTLQPQSTDAVLLVGDIPHCHEPHAQRLSGVLKDRPSRQRRLPLAPLAVQQPPRRHPRLAGPCAVRADESVRPAQTLDILAASSVAAEPLVNFLKRPGVINPRDKVTGVLHHPRLPSGPTGVKRIPYFARTPRPVVAAQRLRGGAVDLAGRGWRGAWLRPAAEIQYRQTPHAFIVPPGLHAVRPDPKHAGKPLAPVDGNLHRHAGCSAPVQEGIWSDLKYEGSLEERRLQAEPLFDDCHQHVDRHGNPNLRLYGVLGRPVELLDT